MRLAITNSINEIICKKTDRKAVYSQSSLLCSPK